MAKNSHKKSAKKPNEGLSGSIGLTAEDDVIDTAFQENAGTIRPESEGGAADFEPDTGRLPLASGGVKRGEAKQLSEEEDDFEDGRSSGGITSRSQEDQIARGDVGSRAVEVRSGYLSVEGPDDADVAETARAAGEPEAPEDIEGAEQEQQGVVAGAAETSRPATPPSFEKSPGIAVPDERVLEVQRVGRARMASGRRAESARRGARGAVRKTGGRKGGGGRGRRARKGAKSPRKTYSQNA